jgi:radical SAM superfamily enzyme YgiQ (UPF0313 family)
LAEIVLTADRALFTDFSGDNTLGFGLCLPLRLVPSFVEYKVLAPPVPVKDGRAAHAPYALGKVEAALLAAGFSRDQVVIIPPEHLEEVVDKDTKVIGVHTVDPQGLAPVSWTLRVLSGGGKTCTAYEFERLMNKINKLKERYKFKTIVGGPGVWQLRGLENKFNIDVLYEGEAEVTFPIVVKKILNGEEVPRFVVGKIAPPEEIPTIVTPSRNGHIQITRGCPRGCQFCKPTTFFFRSMPLDKILREAELNARAGAREINFITDDVLLYGAKGLHLNSEAVKRLFSEVHKVVRKYGIRRITFSHVTLSSALVLKDAVRFITEIDELSEDNPLFPQVGLESGSPKIVDKYFRGKPYPWKPKDWPWIVVEGSKLLNENYWYPCFTYIIGFPDATPDDYVKTIELLDRLRDEGFKGWAFPLFLVPIGGTRIEGKTGFKVLKDLPPEALESIIVGWRMSIDFSRKMYPKVIESIRSPLVRRIVSRLVNKALDAMETWIESIRKDPDVIEKSFSKVNIRSTKNLLISMAKAVIPRRR